VKTELRPSAELSDQSGGQALQLRARLRKLVQCYLVIVAIDGRRTGLQFAVDHPPNGYCGLLVAQFASRSAANVQGSANDKALSPEMLTERHTSRSLCSGPTDLVFAGS
jgi:hypothetical protein